MTLVTDLTWDFGSGEKELLFQIIMISYVAWKIYMHRRLIIIWIFQHNQMNLSDDDVLSSSVEAAEWLDCFFISYSIILAISSYIAMQNEVFELSIALALANSIEAFFFLKNEVVPVKIATNRQIRFSIFGLNIFVQSIIWIIFLRDLFNSAITFQIRSEGPCKEPRSRISGWRVFKWYRRLSRLWNIYSISLKSISFQKVSSPSYDTGFYKP